MSSYSACTAYILFDSKCFHFNDQWNSKNNKRTKSRKLVNACDWHRWRQPRTTMATVQSRCNNCEWNRNWNQSLQHPHNGWRSYYTLWIRCLTRYWNLLTKRNPVKRIGQYVAVSLGQKVLFHRQIAFREWKQNAFNYYVCVRARSLSNTFIQNIYIHLTDFAVQINGDSNLWGFFVAFPSLIFHIVTKS